MTTLTAYCILCIFTMILVLSKNTKASYIFVFISLCIWSIIIRNLSIGQDMITYISVMSYDNDFFKSFYILREPVYWITSKLIFNLTNNPILTLIICDFLIFSLLVYVGYKKNIKSYFLLLLMLFFPNVMGLLNVYRQFLATILLLIMVLIIHDNPIKSKFIYLISILTHNAIIVFLPFVFLKKKFVQINFILSAIFVTSVTVYFLDSKSQMDTGETSPFLFVAVILLIATIFLLMNKFVIYKKSISLYYINTYCVIISVYSSLVMAEAGAKRISMIALIFLLYSIYWIIENNQKHVVFYRFMLIVFAILPTFLFSSVYNMIILESLYRPL